VNKSKKFLDEMVEIYNSPRFIVNDPICIPHQFTLLPDIEIMGFFAAIFAWGNRTTIINKCNELIKRMDKAPHDFVLNHSTKDLKNLVGFKHRTFNDTDLLYCISFFKDWYSKNSSLQQAFSNHITAKHTTIEEGLNGFRKTFFSLNDVPNRTQKHVASPQQNSACKRINMYLRWMVRQDNKGVDFGLWTNIKPTQLVCPLDLHVQRVALKFGLLNRRQSDWKAAIELTENLKKIDKIDPVIYDFALFGLGVNQKF
jgi:uncharacterized protein (TIGR02757 family)